MLAIAFGAVVLIDGDSANVTLVSGQEYVHMDAGVKNCVDIGVTKTSDKAIYLIDEIHTPDSSRYFYADGYEARQRANEPQKQLSKEFVRQWLIENGFQGKEGQRVPEMTDEIVSSISNRYNELYQQVRGERLPKVDYSHISQRIEQSILNSINSANLETKKN
jgi:hypothetical protein